jgi:hypothetical protein
MARELRRRGPPRIAPDPVLRVARMRPPAARPRGPTDARPTATDRCHRSLRAGTGILGTAGKRLAPVPPDTEPGKEQREPPTMTNQDYYAERKWCDACRTYVHYMMSVNHSYCVHCGARVRLFSKEDSQRFSAEVERRKWKAV